MPYCVIPPYILRKIIAHGSGHQQEQARRTLTHVQHLMAEHWQKPTGVKTAAGGHVDREIYDAQSQETLPGKLIRQEGQPGNDDVAAEEAWDYLGVTYDFFWQA